MLLGQLYHYNKVLDDIKLPLSPESVFGVELAGLPRPNPEDFKGMTGEDIARSLRDKFSRAFEKVLEGESLSFAYPYWKLLVSPVVETAENLESGSDFQSLLLSWQENQFALEQLPEVLASGRLALNEEDFAVYYGVRALSVLSDLQKQAAAGGELNAPEVKPAAEVSERPEILVLTKEYLSPLFINLNCLYLPILEEAKDTLKAVQNVLSEESEVKLVLIDAQDKKLLSYLQKNLPANLLITSVQFENFSGDAFFDQIVRQTLGVKLT
jgi:hypothetical protein